MYDLSASFDKVADEYDRYRPRYDPQMIADIKSIVGLSAESVVCEIGPGTGQASIDFVDALKLVCVEPGVRLAELLRRNLSKYDNVEILNTPFEAAELPGESFQLVFGAQSFHWVEAAVRYRKTFDVLKPGGWLCVFWKRWIPSGNECALSEVKLIQEYVPDYVIPTPQGHEEGALTDLAEMVESGLFSSCQLRRYPAPPTHDVRSPEQQAESFRTWSSIAALKRDKQDEFIRRLAEIRHKEPSPMANDETILVLGQKRG